MCLWFDNILILFYSEFGEYSMRTKYIKDIIHNCITPQKIPRHLNKILF